MALTQRLQIRQSQALVMTPQLMQAIKLLQLSNLDLTAYVEAELERNPLLERDADGSTANSVVENPESAHPANGLAPGAGPVAEGESEARGDAADDASLEGAASTRRGLTDVPAGYSEWTGGGASGSRDDAIIISKHSSPQSRLFRSGCASKSRLPSPIRSSA